VWCDSGLYQLLGLFSPHGRTNLLWLIGFGFTWQSTPKVIGGSSNVEMKDATKQEEKYDEKSLVEEAKKEQIRSSEETKK